MPDTGIVLAMRVHGQRAGRPVPLRHRAWRKTGLWLIAVVGGFISVSVMGADLAPTPGHHVQAFGGALGAVGLVVSCWVAWRAYRFPLRQAVAAQPDMAPRLEPAAAAQLGRAMNAPLDSAADVQVSPILAARLELQRRREALAILQRDPHLAGELRIGRPDLPRTFDDLHLVDANHVPAAFLAVVPGVTPALAEKIASVREQVGGFSSIADLEVTLDLPPEIVSQIQDYLIFMPMR
jgi:Helix-hairpin-helix motif